MWFPVFTYILYIKLFWTNAEQSCSVCAICFYGTSWDWIWQHCSCHRNILWQSGQLAGPPASSRRPKAGSLRHNPSPDIPPKNRKNSMIFTYLHLDEFGAIVYLENGTAHYKGVLKNAYFTSSDTQGWFRSLHKPLGQLARKALWICRRKSIRSVIACGPIR